MGTSCVDPIEKAVEAWAEPYDDKLDDGSLKDYERYISRKWMFILVCILAVIAVAGVALTIGEYPIKFFETYSYIWDHLMGNITDETSTADYVIWERRLPRVFTGILAGIGLAVAGVVMQSILRNPLADPYTTGISSGASFGASLAMGLGLSVATAGYAVVLNAFIFALIPMAMIIAVSKMRSASTTTIVMAGIAVMYIFNAMTTVIRLWVNPETQASLYAWTVGSIDGSSWDRVAIMFVFVLIGTIALQLMAKRLNVLSAGDESARSIGVDPDKMRILSLLVVSLLSAGIVSFTGLIGFIGLVCPHIVRLFIGSDTRYLIPASAVFGAALLIFADIVGRVIISPATLQVGVITAFIGGPLFLYLIVKQKKEVW